MSRSVAPVPGAPHGTPGGYTNWDCGCFECKAAHAKAFREARERRAARLAEDPTLAEHGKPTTYSNWRCRCDECIAAWTQAARDRKASS